VSAKFLDSLGGKLAEQWAATLLTPAFIFWAGGAIALGQRVGWQVSMEWFGQQPETLQLGIAIAALGLIVASSVVVQRFELPALRFLEGYWYPWLRPLRRWCVARQVERSRRVSDRWQELAQYSLDQLSVEQREERIFLDWQQRHLPLPNQLMPTRLGNILRAAEQKPLEKYGLDAVICWSRLWLMLPEGVKQDLQIARADLDAAARFWLWTVLFMGWALVGAWWAVPLGILAALGIYYYWAIAAAMTYGDLIEATFDLYRHLLYQSLRWRQPNDPTEERRVGGQLTEYLWRGF
jgi:hypothetical protein